MLLAAYGAALPSEPGLAEPMPLAQCVPESVGVFLHVQDLLELDRAIDRAHARRLYSMLVGDAPAGASMVDLRSAVAVLVGPKAQAFADDMVQAEVAVLASSWGDRKSVV